MDLSFERMDLVEYLGFNVLNPELSWHTLFFGMGWHGTVGFDHDEFRAFLLLFSRSLLWL